MKTLITTEDVAERLGISISTVKRLTAQQKIPFIRVSDRRIAFDPDDLDAWLKTRSVSTYTSNEQNYSMS